MPLPCSEALYGSLLPRWTKSQHFSLVFIDFQMWLQLTLSIIVSFNAPSLQGRRSNSSSFLDTPFMSSFHVLEQNGPSAYNDLLHWIVPISPEKSFSLIPSAGRTQTREVVKLKMVLIASSSNSPFYRWRNSAPLRVWVIICSLDGDPRVHQVNGEILSSPGQCFSNSGLGISCFL